MFLRSLNHRACVIRVRLSITQGVTILVRFSVMFSFKKKIPACILFLLRTLYVTMYVFILGSGISCYIVYLEYFLHQKYDLSPFVLLNCNQISRKFGETGRESRKEWNHDLCVYQILSALLFLGPLVGLSLPSFPLMSGMVMWYTLTNGFEQE